MCSVVYISILHHAQMAESVDALVSNTSGATRAGSTPALGTSQDSTTIAKPLKTKGLAIFLLLPPKHIIPIYPISSNINTTLNLFIPFFFYMCAVSVYDQELENGRKKTKKTGKNTQTSWVENRRVPKYVFAKHGFRR